MICVYSNIRINSSILQLADTDKEIRTQHHFIPIVLFTLIAVIRLKRCLKPKTFLNNTIGGSKVLWLTIYYRLFYECTLSLLFSYWTTHLLMCLHEWNFPEFCLFSIVIYCLHGINKKTLPRINHVSMFLFALSYFPMSYMQSYYNIINVMCYHLVLIQWSTFYSKK